ncbi:hypothetical protein HRbin14_01857 [bacterium HR14]|nr:hypothetical protein HRbin14_01857 [bacterium HR14]
MALIGDQPDFARLAEPAHQRAGMLHGADHRLLNHHMQSFIQRIHRLLEVERVRGDNQHPVQRLFLQHFAVIAVERHALQLGEPLEGALALLFARLGNCH